MKNLFKTFKNNKYKEYLPDLKKEKNQEYFTIILTILAIVFFLLFAINPTLSTIAKLNKDISDSKDVEQNLSTKIAHLSTLSQSYENLKPDLPYVLAAIPSKPEPTDLIAQVQSIAKDSGVTVSNINVSSIGVSNSQKGSFKFSLNVNGDYGSFSTFLSNLSRMQRAVSFDSIIISNNGTGLELSIKGVSYFQK